MTNPDGSPAYGTDEQPAPHGHLPYGEAPYGQAPYGQPASGQAPYGQTVPGQAPYGQAPYGQAPYAPAPYGQPAGGYAAPYGQPYGFAPAAAPRTNGLAIASMVLGILWLYWIGSILALVFGYTAKKQIRERGEGGAGMATAGIVLGWIGVGAIGLSLVFGLAAAGL
jgi:hypothetical protein